MSKHWYLVAMITGLVGCATDDEMSTSSTEQQLAGTDTLFAGEALGPSREIGIGNTVLFYQNDNNLVLYQNRGAGLVPIWFTGADLGTTPGEFVMQGDCNAVVYNSVHASWNSKTPGLGTNCFARVIQGDWFICSGTTRVFSALGGGRCG